MRTTAPVDFSPAAAGARPLVNELFGLPNSGCSAMECCHTHPRHCIQVSRAFHAAEAAMLHLRSPTTDRTPILRPLGRRAHVPH
eukprot:1195712-Prorocentrum_minimum.AAC.2